MKKYLPFFVTVIMVLWYSKAFAVVAPQPVVPEPISATLFLMGAGALGLKLYRRKKA